MSDIRRPTGWQQWEVELTCKIRHQPQRHGGRPQEAELADNTKRLPHFRVRAGIVSARRRRRSWGSMPRCNLPSNNGNLRTMAAGIALADNLTRLIIHLDFDSQIGAVERCIWGDQQLLSTGQAGGALLV